MKAHRSRFLNWMLTFEFLDASASSRSSVNNCTEDLRAEDSNTPESYAKIDFDGMSRKERRQLLARIRMEQPKKRLRNLRRSEKIEAACDKVISQVRDFCGETISRGLAVRLIGGTQTEIAGKMCRASACGDLLRAKPEAKEGCILSRFNRLADSVRAKNAHQ